MPDVNLPSIFSFKTINNGLTCPLLIDTFMLATSASGTMLTGHEHSRSSDQKWNGLNKKGKSYNEKAAKAAFF